MVCTKCGAETENGLICPVCGTAFDQTAEGKKPSVEDIRQGKRAREAVLGRQMKPETVLEPKRRRRAGASHGTINGTGRINSMNGVAAPAPEQTDKETGNKEKMEPGYDRMPRSIYSEEFMSEEAAAEYNRLRSGKKHKHHLVNWVKVSLILFCVAVLIGIGIFVFLKWTDEGQRFRARIGLGTEDPGALWYVGEEKLDSGDINGAIEYFEKASQIDLENEHVDVDGLLLLGSAYEAAGETDQAAELYEYIYTTTPSRPEAYVNHIRILLASDKPGDNARAGELMKTAYDATGEKSFYTQRDDLLPAPPEVDLTAGYYEAKKYIAITSYQGYDVYYTFEDDVELPAGGTKFTERVFLDEGIHNLRAVAVNGELVSDELKGTYKIIMPSPQAPRSNLAPDTYKNRQQVRLKPGKDNMEDDDIVIYYTIDGSEPDADSPVYTGEPFWLPGGRVTLKAYAVNKYGKLSTMLEILYKIEAKPYPLSAYTYEDTANNLKLYSTTMTEFHKRYGEGNSMEEFRSAELETDCRKYTYDWGYAIMSRIKSGWVLAELYFTSNFTGPRGTAVGDSDNYVIGKYRDMGQITSPSGNRGLYETDDGDGKIWLQEDGTSIIRYKCNATDGHKWQLEYYVSTSGTVYAIDMKYIP